MAAPEPPYRWVGILVAVAVVVASMLYHVRPWADFG